MTIQWFPGHMQDTESFLKETLSNVDVVMEIIDARLPASSSNPVLDQMCKSVLRIKVLNKQDLADPVITEQWLEHFKYVNNCAAISITGTNVSDAWRALEFALAAFNASKAVKSRSRRLRVMVVGIPNTGKSTIINTLVGKKVAKTGNVPAITRHQQRTSLKNKVDIYDTPGILWAVIEDKNGAYRLAASGAISDAAIDYSDIAVFVIKYLIEKYPDSFKDRYKISNIDDINMILEKIGAARGCLKKGGVVDLQKASELLIRELRSGKLGRITLESPEDFL
ncbi:MAG: ribosome biogenesis GTPase YlqF [Desulfamplus sp.]